MKRLAIALALTLAGCASSPSMLIPAGSSVCINTAGPVSAGKCEELHRIAMSLNTAEMNSVIQRAQCEAQKELCK